MASKGNEALSDSESEGDSLSSLKVIAKKPTKGQRDASKRTFSTSEVDKEEKTSAKIVTEFLSQSPVFNSPVASTRHAPLLSPSTKVSAKDATAQEITRLDSNTVCKKTMSGEKTPSAAFNSPPVAHRPSDLSTALRPRSHSVPDCSNMQRFRVSD